MNEQKNETAAIMAANQNGGAVAIPAEMQSRIERLYADEQLDRLFTAKAEIMAKSRVMPPMFRGDMYGCYALLQLSYQWEVSPVLLAPGLYKVSDDAPLSLEGKTVKMVLDRWAPFKDHFISDEYIGDWSRIVGKFETRVSKSKTDKYGNPSTYKVPAWKPEDEEGLGIILRAETLTGHKLEYKLLLTQCQTRNSTLWAEDPQLQLWYRAIARFARKYCPGILGGMMTREELADDGEVIDVTPAAAKPSKTKGSATERLAEKLGVPEKPTEKGQGTTKATAPAKEDGVKADDAQKPQKRVSDLVMEELQRQGSGIDFPLFCELLSRGTTKYSPEALEESRPDWLLRDVSRWAKYAIAEQRKRLEAEAKGEA